MHPALIALRRFRDWQLGGYGFDRSREMGWLGTYMEMMNRGGSGGYSRRDILAAKMRPGTDPLRKAWE